MTTTPTHAPDLPQVPAPTVDLDELALRRESAWGARSPRGVEIYRYQEGETLLRDPRFAKGNAFLHRLDRLGVTDGPTRASWEQSLSTNEGPQRTKLRYALAALLGPQHIRTLRTVIRDLVNGILEDLHVDDPVDLMREICWKLPPQVYCHLVSAPIEQAPTVARLSDSILGPLFTEDTTRRQEHLDAHHEALDWVHHQITSKREHLGEDFTSAMIAQHDSGQLSYDELLQEGLTLLTGSVDNSVHQAGLMLAILLEDPPRWQRIADNSDLVPTAVEECIRYRPRFGTIFRQASTDLDLFGTSIAAGEFVFVSIRAAHRDPRRFDDPDVFQVERTPTAPLMFGNGPYRCLGQHLARLELNELLEACTQRFPAAELAFACHQHHTDAVTEVHQLTAHLR